MQRIIVALIVTVVLGLAYASGALAADMTIPPPDFSQMGKAPPDFSQMGKAPPDFLEMGKGKAPPPIIGKGPMVTKGPLLTKAPPLAPTMNWTGYYVGGDAGAAWLGDPATWNPLPNPATFGALPITANERGTAFLGGAHAGYDDQFAPDWVAGIEGDWMWTKAKGTVTEPWIPAPGFGAAPGSQTTMSANLDWLASARARIGYLLAPNLMAYGTGGAAWAKMDYNAVATSAAVGYLATASSSSTQTGYVVGGGLEWMVTDNWSVRAEYLYYQFNKGPNITTQSPAAAGLPSNFVWASSNVSVARAGLSYKF